MIRRNKWILLSLIAILLAVLAACGGGTTDTTGESGSGGSTETSGSSSSESSNGSSAGDSDADPSGEPGKLTIWHIESGDNKAVFDAAIARFEEKHNVEVEAVQHENDPYKTALVVAMGAGNPPDVFHSWGGGWLKQFVDAGQVVDITNDIDANDYLAAALSTTTFDDQVHGLPLSLGIVPVYYNKDIFAEYGLTPPETYDDLLQMVDTLNENDIIPFALANQSKWPGAFYLMYFADRLAGNELFDNAFGRSGRGFDDEAYVRAGEMIQDLVNRNAFAEGFNGLNYDTGQSRSLMYSGRAAMMIQTTGFISNVRDEAPEFEEQLDIFSFPAVEGGLGDPTNVVGGVSPALSVASASENVDLAIELIKELTSVEVAQEYIDVSGKIPAVQGVVSSDPFGQRFTEFLQQAGSMQTYYDQTLPPELGELHKDTTQALFGLDMTPEEAADIMEEKAVELLD